MNFCRTQNSVPGQPGFPGQPGAPGAKGGGKGAQPKAAPIMVTPYQHNWLICGKKEDNQTWDSALSNITNTEKWNESLSNISCSEISQSVKKMANPKRICSRLIPGTAGAESVKDSCVTQ